MGASLQASTEQEPAIRALCTAGDFSAAATLALETYGGEILGFLHARDQDEADAYEAFASFCEQMWLAIPGFRWESSFRTWAYVIARRSYLAVRRAQRRSGHVPLSAAPEVAALAEAVRTRTAPHLRTEVKSRIRRLREQLEPDDRDMLTLRIDRGMSWNEVAQVLDGLAEDADEVPRAAARWRKRFERVKQQLRELSRQADVTDDGGT